MSLANYGWRSMAAMKVEVGVRVFGLGEDLPRTCEVAS